MNKSWYNFYIYFELWALVFYYFNDNMCFEYGIKLNKICLKKISDF